MTLGWFKSPFEFRVKNQINQEISLDLIVQRKISESRSNQSQREKSQLGDTKSQIQDSVFSDEIVDL